MDTVLRPLLVAAIFLGAALPANATIIVADFFRFSTTVGSCTTNLSPAPTCASGQPLLFEFDLRDGLYNANGTVAETHTSDPRALEYVYFYQPTTPTSQLTLFYTNSNQSGQDSLPGIGSRQWGFSGSGLDLAPNEICTDCILDYSIVWQSGLNTFYYLDFHSQPDNWFLNIRQEYVGPGNPQTLYWNYLGTTSEVSRVYTVTSIPDDGDPVSVPEPGTLGLLLAGIGAMGFRRRRRSGVVVST